MEEREVNEKMKIYQVKLEEQKKTKDEVIKMLSENTDRKLGSPKDIQLIAVIRLPFFLGGLVTIFDCHQIEFYKLLRL